MLEKEMDKYFDYLLSEKGDADFLAKKFITEKANKLLSQWWRGYAYGMQTAYERGARIRSEMDKMVKSVNPQKVGDLTYEEAIRFCEEHECKECPANNLPDCRTDLEKQELHYPCCINLVGEQEKNHLLQGWRKFFNI